MDDIATPPDEEFSVVARRDDAELAVWVRGDLDVGARDLVATTIAELADSGPGLPAQIRFHLGGVTFVDSTGVAVLVEALNLIREAHGRVVIEDPPAMLVRLLEISGLADHLVIDVRTDRPEPGR